MKTALLAVLLGMSTLMMSCGETSQVMTNFWKNPQAPQHAPYKSVFIVGMTEKREAREQVEGDVASAAEKLGVKATRSLDVFPMNLYTKIIPSKEEMLAKIRELKCDAIFTVSLLDVKKYQRYVEGATVPMGMVTSYHGGFAVYYSTNMPVVSEPGYYATDKAYFIEGNLYDVGTEELQWSMQSKSYNPENLGSFSRDYAKLLVDKLKKD